MGSSWQGVPVQEGDITGQCVWNTEDTSTDSLWGGGCQNRVKSSLRLSLLTVNLLKSI